MTSSIDRTIPASGTPLVSAPLRTQFGAAADDIEALQGGSVPFTATGSTTPRTLADRFAEYVNVKDFGAAMDGITDDTAAWQAAVNAAQAAGGGIVTAPSGKTTVISAAVNITASGVVIDWQGTVKLTGARTFSAFLFTGPGVLSHPALSADAAAYDTAVQVTALTTGVAQGGMLLLLKDVPGIAGAQGQYAFMTRIRAVSGAGPYTLTLDQPLPVGFAVADSGVQLSAASVITRSGITGDITFDGSIATGVNPVHGVEMDWCVDCYAENLRGTSLTAGSLVYAQFGHNNSFRHLKASACGNANYSDVFLINQTASAWNDIQSYRANGFGPQFRGVVYCVGSNVVSEGASGRGVKFAMSLFGTYSNTQGHRCQDNGVAVSIGSCHNSFHGVVAIGSIAAEGLWTSSQTNDDNKFFGVEAWGNTASGSPRDISIYVGDLRNEFFGVNCGTVYNSEPTTKFYNLNGQLLSMGTVANTPATVLGLDSGSLRLPNTTVGSGANHWIGGDGTNAYWNAPTGGTINLYVGNSRRLYATSTAVQVDVEIAPTTSGNIQFGDASHVWSVGYINYLSMASGRTLDYGSAAPVAGTWVAGAKRMNSVPAVGSPKGWLCTAGGTPGTWVSEGNL